MAAASILVVDDEPSTRTSLRRLFADRGFEVFEAATAESAESEFRAHPPDLAIIDYTLPDATGLELINVLRRVDHHVPMVMLTGRDSVELAVRAVKSGAEHFFAKPVDPKALMLVVQQALDSFRDRRQHEAAQVSEEALTLEEMERHHVERVLRLEGGSVERAAARLGISRSSLYVKLKRYRTVTGTDA